MDVAPRQVRRQLLLINEAAFRELVSLLDAIEIVDMAMRDLSAGLVGAPQRTVTTMSPVTRLGLMPGSMAGIGRFGLKVVSLSSVAGQYGLSSHQGMMLLFDDTTGQPLCALDCHALTHLRTAAASAVATRALSRTDSKSLAIIGCGDLAGIHIDAISVVRDIERVFVWGRSRAKAETFAQSRSQVSDQEVIVTDTVEQAVAGADIVCTLTGSPTPILQGEWLKPGQHLNLVGSSIRAAREADDEVVARGYFIADSRAHALAQAGEFCHAIEAGRVKENHLKGEIGEVLAGAVPGRTSADQITIYKSLGNIAQDISVANAALTRATELAAESDKVVTIDW
jgi:alanine dehydrogenase